MFLQQSNHPNHAQDEKQTQHQCRIAHTSCHQVDVPKRKSTEYNGEFFGHIIEGKNEA